MATIKDFLNNFTKTKSSNLGNTFLGGTKPVQSTSNQAILQNLTPKTTPTGNQSATAPVVAKSTVPTTTPTSTLINTPTNTPTNTPPLSDSGKKYAEILSANQTTPKVETMPNNAPTSMPEIKENPYQKYLDTFQKDYQRVADIQSKNEKQRLDAIAEQERLRYEPGGLLSGTQMKMGVANREADLKSAYGAIEESAAARTAGVSSDVLDRMKGIEERTYNETKPIEVGGQLYQKQADGSYKVIAGGKAPEGFTLGKDQVRYDAQGNVIAGATGTTGVGGEYTTGSNPTIDAYIQGIRNNTLKINDVPDQYKDSVAQGLTTKSTKISDSGKQVLSIVDTLLANPKLSRISGLTDQFLGGITGDAALAKNYFNQLTGILKLENRQQLKGSGAISDFEFKVLGQAATALGRNLDDKNFVNELKKLKDKLTGNAEIPTTPTNGDVWKSPDQTEYEFKDGYWQQIGKSFSSVGKTTASNIPQSNKNPGNVKKGGLADSLAIGTDKQGHLIFPDEQTGFKALTMDLQAKINGQSKYLPANPTIAQLGKVYAEDTKWGEKVAKILGISPLTPTKNIPIDKLVQAIARQEGYYA